MNKELIILIKYILNQSIYPYVSYSNFKKRLKSEPASNWEFTHDR